jgi:hypothetical protein
MRSGAVFPIQLGFLVLGTIGSIAASYRIAEREHPDRSVVVAAPWTVLVVTLAAAAIWILIQPMEMRGISLAG